METKELRKKLIGDFSKLIQDDAKLEILEGFFDAINNGDSTSIVPDEHYRKVEDARAGYLSGNDKTSSWEEVEQRLKTKYGF